MSIAITGVPGAQKVLRKLSSGVVFVSAVSAGLETAKGIIIQRTISGKDVDGKDFESYSDRYGSGKYKKLGISHPNLSQGIVWKKGFGWTSRVGIRMLNDWTQPVVGKNFSGSIGFQETLIGKNLTTAKLVEIHNAGLGHMPKREILGVKGKDENTVVRSIENVIHNSIQ